jgi:alanine racemase
MLKKPDGMIFPSWWIATRNRIAGCRQPKPILNTLATKEKAMSNHSNPTWLEVNLSAVEHNVRYIVENVHVPLMAVVKANAYGHGAVEVGKAALRAGATWLAVARYGEARVLRQAGIKSEMFILGLATPEEVDEAVANDVSLPLHSFEVAEVYAARGKALGKNVRVHLKVDTGLGRIGVLPSEIVKLADYAKKLGNISIEGLFSHFAMADEDKNPMTDLQIKRFKEALQSLNSAGYFPKYIHICNSAGTLNYPEARFTMVRAGSAIVGMNPTSGEFPSSLRRSIVWKAQLTSCKDYPKGWGVSYGQEYILPEDQVIGVVPVGYGDGFRRVKTNEVLIDGKRIHVVGRVCMDQCMVRLPKKYPMGTEVVILGQQGNEKILVEDLANRWKTAEVDVTSIINIRIPRTYVTD